MAIRTTVSSGNWSNVAIWDTGVPVDNDTVIIAAGHTVTFDVDQGAWANGIAGLTITGDAATPGTLRFEWSAAGTYHLKIKAGTTIAGTNTAVYGRILANSDGVWGNTGALPFDRKAIIDLVTTAYVNAEYLDIALYCEQPTILSARVYGQIKDVLSVAPATDTITMTAAHGWANGTPVMITSTGDLPGGLYEDRVYYVRGAAGADLKLAEWNGDYAIVDLTSTGTGTIRIFDGHNNLATAVVNVLDDVTGDARWTTTAGHNYVVLVDAAAPENYDQQRVTLANIAAGQLTLSANVDSVQYPGARVFLVSRNVQIRSSCVTNISIVSYAVGSIHGGIFQCHIHSTAGTGTTFYGNGVYSGTGHTVSGTVSGCNYGFNSGTGHTVSGTVSGCTYGVNSGTGHTVSGTVSGCSSGVRQSAVVFTATTALMMNTYDIYNTSGTVEGAGALNSLIQVTQYKNAESMTGEQRIGVFLHDLGGNAEYLGYWTLGGYTKTAAYNAGVHGVPPVASPFIHETTFEDNTRVNYADYDVWGIAGQPVRVTFYGKLTALAAWTTRPTIGIYDANGNWQSVAERLDVSAEMATNTDWQTLTVTYTPTYDRALRVRMQGQGGNVLGTGTEQLYWFVDISGGGGGRRTRLQKHGV